MNRIEPRQAHSGLWQYALFIDVNGHADDSPLCATLAEFGESAGGVRGLGSCPVAVP
jgi:chorismate mutase/prephenate dehydratase